MILEEHLINKLDDINKIKSLFRLYNYLKEKGDFETCK